MARPGSPFTHEEAHSLAQAADKAGRHGDAQRLRDEYPTPPPPAAAARLAAAPDPKPQLQRETRRRPVFNARRTLARTGFRLKDEVTPSLERLGSLATGDVGGSIGGLMLAIIGGVLGLLLLDLLVSKRGSSITSAALKWTGGGLARLSSPTDPLLGPTTVVPQTGPPGTTGPPKPAQAGPPGTHGAVTQAPTGRAVPIPGTRHTIDASYLGLTEWIAKTFGVTVTSGWRSVVENMGAGGSSTSDHLSGSAADFGGPPAALTRLYTWANTIGFPFVESPTQAVAAGERPHVHISFWRPSPSTN